MRHRPTTRYSLFLAWVMLAAIQPATASTRRLALMVGENDGGRDRVRLQYAVSDAHTLAGSLRELGGVEVRDITVLQDITVEELDAALEALFRKADENRRNGERTEAIVYYSGHADEQGLLLRGRHFPFPRFRSKIDALPADVRIAIVDACASGALTKRKGGRIIPAFLADDSRQTQGYAILTSSSSDEAAQESDRIRASFFSHYLNIGLRGAADASQDERITLHEAYNYAYRETLARTEGTANGPQHASYDMSMTGSGEVVMTELRRATSSLTFPDSIEGRFFVRDMRDRLIAEVNKQAGKPLRLAIDPGQYQVHWHVKNQGQRQASGIYRDKVYIGNLILKQGDEAPVFAAIPWRAAGREVAVARGGLASPSDNREWDGNIDDSTQYHGLRLRSPHDFRGTWLTWGYNASAHRFEGEQFALLCNVTAESHKGMQVGGISNVTHGQMRGGQISGFANFGFDDVRGLQLTNGFNVAQSLSQGVQISEVFNYVGESGLGVQFSPFANWVGGSFTGLQWGFAFNYVGHQIKGKQMFSFLNWAGGPVDGHQLGLVNIAHSYRGGSPVGVLNFVGKGVWRGETWIDETGFQHFGLLTGARMMRTRLAFGTKPLSNRDLGSVSLESAGHFAWGSGQRFFVEPGLMGTILGVDDHDGHDPYPDFLQRLRLTLGGNLGPYLSVSAGLSWAWLITPADRKPWVGHQIGDFDFDSHRMHMWPGAHVSVQVGTLGLP